MGRWPGPARRGEGASEYDGILMHLDLSTDWLAPPVHPEAIG